MGGNKVNNLGSQLERKSLGSSLCKERAGSTQGRIHSNRQEEKRSLRPENMYPVCYTLFGGISACYTAFIYNSRYLLKVIGAQAVSWVRL